MWLTWEARVEEQKDLYLQNSADFTGEVAASTTNAEGTICVCGGTRFIRRINGELTAAGEHEPAMVSYALKTTSLHEIKGQHHFQYCLKTSGL